MIFIDNSFQICYNNDGQRKSKLRGGYYGI